MKGARDADHTATAHHAAQTPVAVCFFASGPGASLAMQCRCGECTAEALGGPRPVWVHLQLEHVLRGKAVVLGHDKRRARVQRHGLAPERRRGLVGQERLVPGAGFGRGVRGRGVGRGLLRGHAPDTDIRRVPHDLEAMQGAEVLAGAGWVVAAFPEVVSLAVAVDPPDALGRHPVHIAGDSRQHAPAAATSSSGNLLFRHAWAWRCRAPQGRVAPALRAGASCLR
mmetsp:Transcript_33445/g.106005  ORF Transcript_33445/g.106005 Transcript_33445/m.106005 type:complete len:226 (-) Transcript_33445:11-688(-)